MEQEYIPFSELPPKSDKAPGRYPYEDWRELPVGQAIEVTSLRKSDEELNAFHHSLTNCIRVAEAGRGLAATKRGERVFVYRKEPAP